jgi:hypothetical protein
MGHFRKRLPSTPDIAVPEHCVGRGAMLINELYPGSPTANVEMLFTCSGIADGDIRSIYYEVYARTCITAHQLNQLKVVGEVSVAAMCVDCPANPANRAPNDASELFDIPEAER